MNDTVQQPVNPVFHTVPEAAHILRCDTSTLYRAIRHDGFPAVRIRSRYIIPAKVIDAIVNTTVETGTCIHPASIATLNRVDHPRKRTRSQQFT